MVDENQIEVTEDVAFEEVDSLIEEEQPAVQPQIFSITLEAVNELAEAINDTVKSVHIKQVLFGILNANLKRL